MAIANANANAAMRYGGVQEGVGSAIVGELGFSLQRSLLLQGNSYRIRRFACYCDIRLEDDFTIWQDYPPPKNPPFDFPEVGNGNSEAASFPAEDAVESHCVTITKIAMGSKIATNLESQSCNSTVFRGFPALCLVEPCG